MTAHEVTGEEPGPAVRCPGQRSPQFAEYQQKTDRTIPVLVLAPR